MDPSVRKERDSQRPALETVDARDCRLAGRGIDGVVLQKPSTPGTADWQGKVLAGDRVLLLRQLQRDRSSQDRHTCPQQMRVADHRRRALETLLQRNILLSRARLIL